MDCYKKCNSSHNSSLISGEEKPKRKHIRRHSTKQQSHRRNNSSAEKGTSRQTNLRTTDRHISQQIKVEKQEFQCIINLNTTVCKHKSKYRKRYHRKHRSRCSNSECDEKPYHSDSGRNNNKKDKIVPICFREVCHRHTSCECKLRRNIIQRSSVKNSHKEKTKTTNKKDDEKYDYRSKSRHVYSKCRHSKHRNKQKDSKVLPSIFPLPVQDDVVDNLTYEDISTTSLETLVEKPTSHKHLKRRKRKYKGSCLEIHDSKLDTLIRRTKERERKLVEQSRGHKPWFTSTPINEFSSGDFPMSNSVMENSFNSRSTFVLDTRSHYAYSPLCPVQDLDTSCELNSGGAYSPSSPIRGEYYTFNDLSVPRNDDYKLVNVKNGPMMDTEAYSPICSPDSPDDYAAEPCDFTAQNRVKDEVVVKTERLFSPKLSPIYCENSELQFCKIESIKSDVVPF